MPTAGWSLASHSRGFAAIGTAAAHVGHEDGQPLGTVHFPVSCTPEVQAAFEHGLALLHHMTYPQAVRRSSKSRQAIPSAQWRTGAVAMTLFQPLWPTRPGAEARQRGWDETPDGAETERHPRSVSGIHRNRARRSSRTLQARTTGRIRRWEAASEKLHRRLAGRRRSAAFFALAAPGGGAAERVRDRTHDGSRRRSCCGSTSRTRTTRARCTTSCTRTTCLAASASRSPSRASYEERGAAQPARAAHADAHLHAPRRLGRRHSRQPARGRGGARASRRRERRVRLGRVLRTRSSTWATRTCSAGRRRRVGAGEAAARDGAARALVQDRHSISPRRRRDARSKRGTWGGGRVARVARTRLSSTGKRSPGRKGLRSSRAASARCALGGSKARARQPAARGTATRRPRRRARSCSQGTSASCDSR